MKLILHLLAFLLFTPYVNAQVYGCTDPLSSNYNANATENDGSCIYPSSTVSVVASVEMPDTVEESSGLIIWNGGVYTHNDDGDNNLYRISPANGEITQTLTVAGTVNQDWEDIAQDETYVYIGDFGNNVNGNRTNLRIIKTVKNGLLQGDPVIQNINFSYANQTSFTGTGNNNTDFDCEAMVVGTNYIYLFTKQWVSHQTSVYRLPKTPGTHIAELLDTFDVNGLITGAAMLESQKLVALCGYSTTLSPFIYLLYDYEGDDFFSANKRKISVSENFTQIEGIATENGMDYYLSCEHFNQVFVNTEQQLFTVNLGSYLEGYLGTPPIGNATEDIIIYPNPAGKTVNFAVKPTYIGRQYLITDASGKTLVDDTFKAEQDSVDISSLAAGIYRVTVTGYSSALNLVVK
ncbi:T9SS type A sorting domain-containing protein [Flavobacterium sp. RHBU_24]|uniref:T9SS type A sorting domain-containing protein n=1 Tax=Flavobacterium sp. RHBU_24 TaxID=3391185 RepID=UPI003984EA06